MLKRKIAAGVLCVVAMSMVGHAVFPLAVRAQSVEQAGGTLSTTEERLQREVTKSTAAAQAVQQELGTPNREGLPQELVAFRQSTQRLTDLGEELTRDISAYEEARRATLASFDAEVQAIGDERTRHPLLRLRSRLARQTNERLTNARSVMAELQTTLATGRDVTHATRCVQLAAELDAHGQDLDAQITKARAEAIAYGRVTTTLLAALRTSPGESPTPGQ
jgi:hypothetical protein